MRIGLMAMAANMVRNLISSIRSAYWAGAGDRLLRHAERPCSCSRGSISRMSIALPATPGCSASSLAATVLMGLLAYLSPELAQWGLVHMGKASWLDPFAVAGGCGLCGCPAAAGDPPRAPERPVRGQQGSAGQYRSRGDSASSGPPTRAMLLAESGEARDG